MYMGTRDKYDPIIKPRCKPTPFQVLLLESSPFSTIESQQQSSSEEEEVQPTGIIMLSLSDDYQTPPQNSTQNVPDLNNDTEEILDDAPQVFDEMPRKNSPQVFDEMPPQKDTPQVFDEIPDTEQKEDVPVLDKGKRKLPFSLLDNKVTENKSTEEEEGQCSKDDAFKLTINRVLKMLVAKGKEKGSDDVEKGVDFFETAKNKGMTFPRPRWRSAESWKGV